MTRALTSLCLLLLAACGGLLAEYALSIPDWEPRGAPARAVAKAARGACAATSSLRQPFFGDLHVHTAYSMDARSRGMLGTPDDAYRFARGETIGLGPFDTEGKGLRRVRLERPLDFAAVTDHAEWIGEVSLCSTPDSPAYATSACRTFRREVPARSLIPTLRRPMTAIMGFRSREETICGTDASLCRASLLSAWQTTQQATERWNDTSEACSFTAFHGWEHSNSAGLSKIHRNVIFRNAAVPELPISSLEAPDAIQLWDRLDALCTNGDSGCEAVTIPHNPNVSNGRLLEIAWRGEAPEEQKRQAEVRARIERVVEIMQVKGESECKNGMFGVVGGEDELCDFEKLRGLPGVDLEDCGEGTGQGAISGEGCQSRRDFARYALIEGMREQERLGINPLRFGFIGSTDTHNATPGDAEEYSYDGCCANGDDTAQARLAGAVDFAGRPRAARNPGGLMGVWAEENSRDSIFDAIVRRETFATSGPRLVPRFFGGWDLPDDACSSGALVARGYAAGVAMGGVLDAEQSQGRAPVFVASVARDPGTREQPGGLLDRLQIIKVWYGEDGLYHQEVHDLAGRVAGGGSAPSVDLATCQPRGSGRDSLCAAWRDAGFDPGRAAAYYVRAVENPSCRWSWRQCLELPEGERPAACSDPSLPRTIQERVWTSPIWVDPA